MGKKREFLNKDWLYQKYIIENLSWKEIAKLAGCGPSYVDKMVKFYKFSKTKEKVVEARTKTMLEKYGFENAAKVQELQENKKKQMLKNMDSKINFNLPL
jgi:endonuclease III-like uncharacterized protein